MAGSLDRLWDELFPAERERIVRTTVAGVDVGEGGIELSLRIEGLRSLLMEIQGAGAPSGRKQ